MSEDAVGTLYVTADGTAYRRASGGYIALTLGVWLGPGDALPDDAEKVWEP